MNGSSSSSASHAFLTDGTYVIHGRVTDLQGASTDYYVSVIVNEVAPTLTYSAATPTTISQGSNFVLNLSASDPGSEVLDHWTIDWGDGTVVALSGAASAVGHAYVTAGTFTPIITGTGEAGTITATAPAVAVHVQDVSPVVTTASLGGAASLVIGSTLNRDVSFFDPGTLETWSALINYGDGSPVVKLSNLSSPQFHLYHVYDNVIANYSAQVTVTGSAGGVGNATLPVSIPNLAGLSAPLGSRYALVGAPGAQTLDVSSGAVTALGDLSSFYNNLTVTIETGATITFNSSQNLANLTLNGGSASISSASRYTVNLHTLAITSSSLFDIASSFLYIDNTYSNIAAGGTQASANGTPYTTIHQYVSNVYNLNGSPNPGQLGDYAGRGGIGSSTAKASYAGGAIGNVSLISYDGAQQDGLNPLGIGGLVIGPNAASGNGTGIPLGKTLIRATATGDLNGDNVVDDFDITLFSAYGLYKGDSTGPHTNLGPQVGDFNLDGVVDDTDILILSAAGNYNLPRTAPSSRGSKVAPGVAIAPSPSAVVVGVSSIDPTTPVASLTLARANAVSTSGAPAGSVANMPAKPPMARESLAAHPFSSSLKVTAAELPNEIFTARLRIRAKARPQLSATPTDEILSIRNPFAGGESSPRRLFSLADNKSVLNPAVSILFGTQPPASAS